MDKMIVTLSEADVVELQVILIDRDQEAALQFLEERVAPKLPRISDAPCDSNRMNPYLLKREQ